MKLRRNGVMARGTGLRAQGRNPVFVSQSLSLYALRSHLISHISTLCALCSVLCALCPELLINIRF